MDKIDTTELKETLERLNQECLEIWPDFEEDEEEK